MTKNVCFTSEFTVEPEKKDDFLALTKELIAEVEKEPGTLAYEWHVKEDGRSYYVYERYQDSAAALAHFGNFGRFAERFVSLTAVTGFNVYGDVSDELRAAVADWNSPRWTLFAGFVR